MKKKRKNVFSVVGEEVLTVSILNLKRGE